jgi:two-component system NtrC family sensor kinase
MNNFLLSAALSSFALDQGASLGRELALVDPIEGSDILFEVICQSVIDPRTQQRGLVTVLKNVSDLQRAIEEVRHGLRDLEWASAEVRNERDRLNLILENVADPIVVTGPAGEVLLMNPHAARLLQPESEKSAAGRAGAYYGNNTKLMSFLLQASLDAQDVLRTEVQFTDPLSEDPMTLSATATKARNAWGQVVALVCVLHDLTQLRELERRRVEHQLFESEKLAAVGRLAAAMAHEINNPLEAIKNSLHLVVTTTKPDDPNHRFLNIAARETDRVSRIIREMLGFYRPGRAKMPVSVNQLIEEALDLMQRQFGGQQFTIVREMEPQLPAVWGAEDQLKQVFLNLLLNAYEAMGKQGTVRVVTRRSLPQDQAGPPSTHVIVEVQDTGGGIAQEIMDHIFDPFFSTKRDQHGTGLGLWISLDIVKQHGGQINVRSTAGRGTTFAVALPIGGQNG